MRIGIDPLKQVTHPARNIVLQGLENQQELSERLETAVYETWAAGFNSISQESKAGVARYIAADADGVIIQAHYGFINAMDWGAIADGDSHPLSERFATLAEAQEYYPHAIALTDEIDWCACQAIALVGKTAIYPAGIYVLNRPLTPASYTQLVGLGRAIFKYVAAPTFGTWKAMIEFVSKVGYSVDGLELDSSGITTFTGGYRDIFNYHSSNYRIENCRFTTPGGAIASLDSFDYLIANNNITIDAFDGVAKHDGIIDQWEGSHGFVVRDNVIHGAGIGRYGILVTGQRTDLTYTPVYDFVISNNRVYNVLSVGVWVNGRQGHAYRFNIVGNIVDTVTNYFGISLMDCFEFACVQNRVKSTGSSGIICGKETSGGLGDYGARDGFIGHNSVRDANALIAAGEAGWAIASQHADNTNLYFCHNSVRGVNHVYAMGIRGTRVKVVGQDFDLGTSGNVNNRGMIDSGVATEKGFFAYTPTLTGTANVSAVSLLGATFKCEDGYVEVHGRISVTPTAAASTLTTVTISLPVASNFGSANSDGAGVASTGFGLVAEIFCDPTTDTLTLRFPAPNTSANSIGFVARYKVI
jgi:hypothetical protein